MKEKHFANILTNEQAKLCNWGGNCAAGGKFANCVIEWKTPYTVEPDQLNHRWQCCLSNQIAVQEPPSTK